MEIVFSKRAKNYLEDLLKYLETEWSIQVKHNFVYKLDKSVISISKFPESCPLSGKKKGVYKCIVSKQTSFYYRIKSNKIEVIAFFDNRMNPRKIKL